jgi:hypothetical protein
MKNALLAAVALIGVSFLSIQPAYATDAEICEIRAAIVGSAAQERDKGVSKQKVKRMLGKELAGMSGYIDLVYDQMKKMSPREIADLTRYSCLHE